MCLTLATGLAAMSGVMGAVGSIASANAQAKAYKQQAEIAQYNARLAELQGVRELEKGARDEQRFRRKARQFQATQRSQLAASGTQLAGSALSVLADTASGIEQDAAVLRYNTLQNKWQRDVQAVNYRNEASMARANASNAMTAGVIGAFGGLLNTGADIAGMNAFARQIGNTSNGVIAINNNNFEQAYLFNRGLRYNDWSRYYQLYGGGRYGF